MIADIEFAKEVVQSEGRAIIAMSDLMGEPFAHAANMLYETSGSVIITGIMLSM